MSDQVQVDLIVKAMASGFDSVNNTFTELKSKFDLASQALQAVGTAFKKAYEFAKEGAEIELTAWRFDRLTESIGTTSEAIMGDLETSTAGLLSQSQTMKLATDMMALGLANSADQVVRLSGVSAQLGMDVGEMTLALTNQTTKRFDQLGVSTVGFEERLKALKAQGMDTNEAFTEAFLQQAESQIERVGSIADTTAGQFKTLESNAANLLDTLKQLASAGAEPTVKKMIRLTGAADDGAKNFLNLSKVMDNGSMSFKDFTAIILNHIFGIESLWDANDRLTTSIEYLQGPLGPLAPMFEETGEAAEEAATLFQASAEQIAAYEDNLKATADHTATMRDRANEAALGYQALATELYNISRIDFAQFKIEQLQGLLEVETDPGKRKALEEEMRAIAIAARLASEASYALADGVLLIDQMTASGALSAADYSEALDVAKKAAADGVLTYGELTEALETAGLTVQTTASIMNEQDIDPIIEDTGRLAGNLAGIAGADTSKTFTYTINVRTTGPIGLLGQGGFGRSDTIDFTEGGEPTYDHATGGSFVIPPGFPNDSFPLGGGHYGQSGETVTVTPAGQSPAGSESTAILQGMIASLPRQIEIAMMQAMAKTENR